MPNVLDRNLLDPRRPGIIGKRKKLADEIADVQTVPLDQRGLADFPVESILKSPNFYLGLLFALLLTMTFNRRR